jgi:DNA-binding response OmpR family regulator
MNGGQSRATILVVDDVATVRTWACAVLTRAGLDVVAEEEPTRISVSVSRYHPDLVLLDVSMPTISGDRIVGAVKNFTHPPLVVLHSSKPQAELQELCRRSGADGFIVKTSNPDDFVHQVRMFLSRRGSQQ